MGLLLLLIGACSSLPRMQQPPEKRNADQHLLLGQKYELQQRFADSEAMYIEAESLYQAFADIEGIMQCLSGMARLSLLQSDPKGYEYYRERINKLVQSTDPSLAYHEVLLEIYSYYLAGDWDGIKQLAQGKDIYPVDARIQILSYRAQANAWQRKPDEKELKKLVRLYFNNRNRLVKEGKPQIVSMAAYSLAYHYFVANELPKSTRYLQTAKLLDYNHSQFSALANDLWLEANIMLARGNPSSARLSLQRAKIIFANGGNSQMMERIDKLLEKLSEGTDR